MILFLNKVLGEKMNTSNQIMKKNNSVTLVDRAIIQGSTDNPQQAIKN